MRSNNSTKPKGLPAFVAVASVAIVLYLASACTEPSQPTSIGRRGVQAPASTTSASSTAIYTSLPATPTDPLAWMYYSGTGTPPALLTQRAHESAYATSDVRILTQAAPTAAIYGLTYTAIALGPTRTPMPLYPTDTPILGLFHCYIHGYPTNTCWAGMVNGQVILAVAARGLGDQYSSLAIYHGLDVEYYPNLASDEQFPLPCNVLSAGIASVNGNQLTIIPQNVYGPTPTPAPTPVVLVFDLATRQWVSSTCGPLPTQTPYTP